MTRALLLFAVAAAATAAPLCITDTMSAYTASGFACTTGPLTFSDFIFLASGTAAPLPSSAGVLVVPDVAGLNFIGPFAATAGSSLDALIRFTVTSTIPVTGEILAMLGFGASGGGAVNIAESLCLGATCANTASLNVFANATASKATDSVAFAPVLVLGVVKDISVLGGAAGTSSSAAVSFVANDSTGTGIPTQQSFETPEARTLLFALGGLLALHLARKIK